VVGGGVAGGLLRCHVRRRAEHDPNGRDAGGIGGRRKCLGDAEVGDRRVTPGEENVLRFDVAMNDPVLVCVGESVGHLLKQTQGIRYRQLTLAMQPRAQTLAVDEGHRVVEQTLRFGRDEQRHDVGVLKAGGKLDLALEALDVDRGRELRRQDLDHDVAAERRLLSEKDARHAAAAELTLEAICAPESRLELLAQISRHRRTPVRNAANLGRVVGCG